MKVCLYNTLGVKRDEGHNLTQELLSEYDQIFNIVKVVDIPESCSLIVDDSIENINAVNALLPHWQILVV